MKGVWRDIRDRGCVGHASALVRVERDVKVLGDNTTLGDIVEVDLGGIEDKVLSSNGKATGD